LIKEIVKKIPIFREDFFCFFENGEKKLTERTQLKHKIRESSVIDEAKFGHF
jgi:hypothetical protein